MIEPARVEPLAIVRAAVTAQAATAIGVCNEMWPCFACALDEFAKESAPLRDAAADKLFQMFAILLRQYVNTFGAALLAAQGVTVTVMPGKGQKQATQAIERYTAAEVAGLLRGFGLFFILFKVEAPDEIKTAWLTFTAQLAGWLGQRSYVPAEFELSFEPPDDDARINALCAAGFINELVERRDEDLDFEPYKERAGEQYYLVSRVVPGKLWFLYSSSTSKCAEFGPVMVPVAVANFIKPGWGLDCKFFSMGGRWHISKVNGVLPV